MSPEVVGGWDDAREKKEPSIVLDDGVIRMREVWVGNLAQTVTETTLYNYFFIYGEIEKIDVFALKGFGFVRFKQTAAAARAVERANGTLIEGRPIKVSFSDQMRRSDAIGDKPGYEPSARNARTLYVQYNKDGPIQFEGKMQEVLNRYGRVKALYIKQMPPNSFSKSYLYVDYVTHEEAENALFHLYENDKGGLRRQELGDGTIEITYAFNKQKEAVEKPNVDPQTLRMLVLKSESNKNVVRSILELAKSGPATDNNPMARILSRLTDEQKRKLQTALLAINQNPAQESNAALMKEIASTLGIPSTLPAPTIQSRLSPSIPMYPTMNPTLNPVMNPPMRPPGFPQSMSQLYYPTGRLPVPFAYPSHHPSNIHAAQAPPATAGYIPQAYRPPPPAGPYPYQPVPGSVTNNNPIINLNKDLQTYNPLDPFPTRPLEVPSTIPTTSTYNKPIINQPELPPKPETKAEEPKRDIVIADELEHVWSGFITRNKQNRVGVDAHLVSGDLAEFFTDYNLNISHRTSLDELNRIGPAILGMIVFTSQNETQNALFDSYIDYFAKKERAGIIHIRPHILIYLVPPCEYTKKYVQTKESHMLGVLVNTNKLPKSAPEEPKKEVADVKNPPVSQQSGNTAEEKVVGAPKGQQQALVASIMANPKLLAMLNDPQVQMALSQSQQKQCRIYSNPY
eukprot:TRINITY_DN463_c0_g1_i1.p1 TRINITY_DN463_c0_g1~~TRINITY_DN463_c0_g1_i1.p1  ORF type:complete len:683 (-),score=57.33 TRINITY_DN463_c0_g1_i1:2519-4567(-)